MNLFDKFNQGLSYADFIDRYANDAQKQRWQQMMEMVKLTPAQRELLGAFTRRINVLVLAGAWCGDCINQCPIFEHFAAAAPDLQTRYLDRDEHADVQRELRINAGDRVPVLVFFSEDGFDLRRVEAAARLAAVHDEIVAMPLGYHSLVGDMGTALSGGQKQRIILARALYRRPRVLFLDEATSHLDLQCERRVGCAVQKLKLTRLIIAHRPETIASADRVLLLQSGRIAREFRPRGLPNAAAGEAAAA